MAKMFYTLEETAAALDLTDDDIRQMATDGKLQQFRDRDKLMFKREQVDKLSNKASGDTATNDASGGIPLADGSSISGDAVSLGGSAAGETGISIFDTGEFDLADPAAATQISDTSDIGLELDASAASGSGLMELANDASDDTNLGAVLLDASNADSAFGSSLGSGLGSGLGDSAFSASGLGESALDASALGASAFAEATGMGIPAVSLETSNEPNAAPQVTALGGSDVDSAWSGITIGALFVASIAMAAVLFMSLSSAGDSTDPITKALTADSQVLIYTGGAAAVALVVAGICGFIGKASG